MMKLARGILLLGCLLALLGAQPLMAAQLQILLPLGRVAYQTNEQIDISVIRSDAQALPATELALTLTDGNGSRLAFTFPVKAAPVVNNQARITDNLHVNGWLLRPGKYTVAAAAHGAQATAQFEVYSHERTTSYKLLTWGRCNGKDLVANGEDGFGFNLYYSHYGGYDQDYNIRGGVDFMQCCAMGGGHQMDLRMECDWSDPNVLAGGRARVTRAALAQRTNANCLGIHFYDEPGLSWWSDPVSGEVTNNSLPVQLRSFKAAFGYDVPYYKTLDAKNPEQAAKWREFARWKTSLMDAAWQDAKFGVKYVRPDFLTATQSQYGWMSFSDGYYFQVVRSLDVTSGHGGYHDWGPGYWHPSFTVEIARARDISKPCWYLPTWYGNTTSDLFRLEQYLSFQTNIQGMITPPDLDPMLNPGARDGITESNKLMGRFGTVFTTMPVTRGPVAILYSLSHLIGTQTKDISKVVYAQSTEHGASIHIPYIATKLLQQNSQFVVDEDVVDGTLQANYKAIVLNAVDILDPGVIAGLERFIAKGGIVLKTSDSQVQIKGAIDMKVAAGYLPADVAEAEALKKGLPELEKDKVKNKDAITALNTQIGELTYGLRASLKAATVMANAMKPYLNQAGITPVLTSSEPGISATRQAYGDVEYLLTVNATHDFTSPSFQLATKAVKSTISLPDDGRPVYDAIRGGAVAELKADAKAKTRKGDFSFGPGSIRIFARTARPISKVLVLKPTITTDTTQEKAPVQVHIHAMVLDNAGDVLSGSFPLRIRVVDALGAVRYDLYRATRDGVIQLPLTLAANDPAGAWTVEVTELLNNTTGKATFTYRPMSECGAMAGATPRAIYFGNDRENMKRFFRVNKSITLIKGTSDFSAAAADRLAAAVKPWGVKCVILDAATVNKPEPDPKDEWLIAQMKNDLTKPGRTTTWCGPGGYDVPGPSVLIGNPEDNPLIKGIAEMRVLPYAPKRDDFPGRGRGMIAWQLDCVRQGLESVTVIAYDAEGMTEAIGCLYETAADQDPITPLLMPAQAEVTPATKAVLLPEATIAWRVNLPDRADTLTVAADKVSIITHDGTMSVIDATGKLLSQKAAAGAAPATKGITIADAVKPALLEGKIVKSVATNGNLTAITYWGGTVQVLDTAGAVKAQQMLAQDTTGVAWVNGTLVVGLADGQVLGLKLP